MKNPRIDALKSILKLFLGRGVFNSYSQFGEDAVVWPLLRRKPKGIYVDVGAYHPALYSNTYALYRKGWNGIVVDPNESFRPLYRYLRPRDIFLHAGVGVGQEQTYLEFRDGAYNCFEGGAHPPGMQPMRKYQVKMKPLSEIIKTAGAVDFLNIDVQGMDLEVLKTHDWAVFPRVIAVEAETGGERAAVEAYLGLKGYELRVRTGATLIFKYSAEQ